MTKLTEIKITFKGESGKKYSFESFSLDTEFNKVGGIYIFTRRYKKTNENYYHEQIYCGKTEDLSTRFNNHHKEDCIKNNNANCICVISVSSEDDRTEIETDILKGNNFTCNEVLN